MLSSVRVIGEKPLLLTVAESNVPIRMGKSATYTDRLQIFNEKRCKGAILHLSDSAPCR